MAGAAARAPLRTTESAPKGDCRGEVRESAHVAGFPGSRQERPCIGELARRRGRNQLHAADSDPTESTQSGKNTSGEPAWDPGKTKPGPAEDRSQKRPVQGCSPKAAMIRDWSAAFQASLGGNSAMRAPPQAREAPPVIPIRLLLLPPPHQISSSSSSSFRPSPSLPPEGLHRLPKSLEALQRSPTPQEGHKQAETSTNLPPPPSSPLSAFPSPPSRSAPEKSPLHWPAGAFQMPTSERPCI